MKKQVRIYVLLSVVLGIWGLIGFKVVNTINPPRQEAETKLAQAVFSPKEIKQRDTFSISANYRDPFLGTMPKINKPKKQRKITPEKKEMPEKNIVYSGFVTENASGNKIFFITIDGQQEMMTKNGIFKEVKLLSGDPEKVKVKYNGKIKNIPLIQ